MRLWQKIVLPTLALMVLSTALASILLLRASRDALWEREGQRAVTQLQYLAGMLRAGVISHRLQQGAIQLRTVIWPGWRCWMKRGASRSGPG